jgi:long-chain acyl-CoA synthetase
VVDRDDPTVAMPLGEPGELVIAGPQVMRGYWNRPEESASAFTADGYLRTGDIAVMDDEGFFSIVDRKKEMIIAGGFNIFPSEVEEVLFRHPAVADAAVAGVPDSYRGETVKAYVVLKPGQQLTEEELVAFCREHLAAYKVPKLVEFRADLPRTMVGKVLRRKLIEEERARQDASASSAVGDAAP